MSRPAIGSTGGDLLATLDPTFSQADHDQLRNRVAAFDASIARLRAELADSDYVVADLGNADAVLQQNMFLQRKSTRNAQMQNFDAQIASAQANLKTAESEEASFVAAAREHAVDRVNAQHIDGQGSWFKAQLPAISRCPT